MTDDLEKPKHYRYGRYVIQFAPGHSTHGFSVVNSFGKSTFFDEYTFGVSGDHLDALDEAGVPYTIVEDWVPPWKRPNW